MSSSSARESLSEFKPTTFEEAPIPTFVMPNPISPIRAPRRGFTIAGEAERRRVTVACQEEVEPQVRIRRETEDKEVIRADGTKHKIRRTLRVEEWTEPLPVQPKQLLQLSSWVLQELLKTGAAFDTALAIPAVNVSSMIVANAIVEAFVVVKSAVKIFDYMNNICYGLVACGAGFDAFEGETSDDSASEFEG
ncbi:hypothetical protein CHS0354_024779 [Potamilus streckersoni]|uniref:Uncharacterized protein n=1 Tax=Potamilus streckersoni TaxID=2493646 RepID=A0AAE0T1C7_9BIVA|nr:hypothetical protein CHS0354_024779 [Potamilus streckersoni]